MIPRKKVQFGSSLWTYFWFWSCSHLVEPSLQDGGVTVLVLVELPLERVGQDGAHGGRLGGGANLNGKKFKFESENTWEKTLCVLTQKKASGPAPSYSKSLMKSVRSSLA